MVLLRTLSVAVLLLLSPSVWAGDAYHGTVAGVPAAIRKALRGNLRAARRFARRHGDTPGAEEAGLALRMAAWAKVARRRVTGMRSTTVTLSSSSDWRDLGIEAEAGDLVAIESEGEWRLGGYAGFCDATGLSGERYRMHSTVEELRHGCLLVRAGSNLFVAGTPHGAVRLDEEATRIEAKCNDETYRDNTGAITLRVLVLPASGRRDR